MRKMKSKREKEERENPVRKMKSKREKEEREREKREPDEKDEEQERERGEIEVEAYVLIRSFGYFIFYSYYVR
jgi:hypothetical protein